MESPYLIERNVIIQRLLKRMPYPESWFQRKTDKQLYAMFVKGTKYGIECTTIFPKIRINQDTGIKEVLTDSGNWEELQE